MRQTLQIDLYSHLAVPQASVSVKNKHVTQAGTECSPRVQLRARMLGSAASSKVSSRVVAKLDHGMSGPAGWLVGAAQAARVMHVACMCAAQASQIGTRR